MDFLLLRVKIQILFQKFFLLVETLIFAFGNLKAFRPKDEGVFQKAFEVLGKTLRH